MTDPVHDRYWSRNGPVTDWKSDVGPGWHSLLDQLHAELSEIAPDYKTAQVKEKFGKLRVYIDLPPGVREMLGDAIWQVLGKYEDMSGHTCEDCGQPGEIRTSRSWLRTLCDACEAQRHVISSLGGE